MARTSRLIHIPFSHYNECARWALDLGGVKYISEPVLPILHFPVLAAARWKYGGKPGADKISTKFSTPYFVPPKGPAIQDTRNIVRWVDEHRLGWKLNTCDEQVEQSMTHSLARIGPLSRRWAYYHVLKDKELTRQIFGNNIQGWQHTLGTGVALPLITAGLQSLGISRDRALRSEDLLLQDMEVTADILRQSDGYLLGRHFTAADLTFACMLAPALMVQPEEGYSGVLPKLSQLNSEAREFAVKLRSTPAGKFALDMFARHRGTHVAPPSDKAVSSRAPWDVQPGIAKSAPAAAYR